MPWRLKIGRFTLGKLTIVGIGPGNYDNMTIAADRALRESQLIVGYTV